MAGKVDLGSIVSSQLGAKKSTHFGKHRCVFILSVGSVERKA
ncbi:hypothetical protein RISK_005833 [Rhodopirellula islandica]|uniref:Uncharacterized protein n=1 Tax=Rhodopirellula islandica TaxID=595434 RepID=A0A0J1B6E4_RHOIS|nr:hypothetical protein RISK_005833 [Rhodopirellula islandica]